VKPTTHLIDGEPLVAPSVDEAVAALRGNGGSGRLLRWPGRRAEARADAALAGDDIVEEAVADNNAIVEEAVAAEHAAVEEPATGDEPAGETPVGGDAPGAEQAPRVDEIVADEDLDVAALQELGPYVGRLMAHARREADRYRRDTEREVAQRAADMYAKAKADAEAIRSAAQREADATLEAAQRRAEALVARVSAMAAELSEAAPSLLAPDTQVYVLPAVLETDEFVDVERNGQPA
jgi:hypothetical protein